MNLPDPEVRFWRFRNGLGAAARVSRDLLLGGIVAYEAWAFDTRRGGQLTVSDDLVNSGFYPETLRPIVAGSEAEVEALLSAVESYAGGAR